MSSLTLIVAEDDHFMREWLSIVLQGLDARVYHAANGHELLNLLAEIEAVDLVISDIRMPGPSGLDVLANARAGGNQVPFLFITGYGGADVVSAAAQLGASLLAKPFSRQDLLAHVNHLCRRCPRDGDCVRGRVIDERK